MEETWEEEEKGRSWIEHDILTAHCGAQYFDRFHEAENSRTHVQRRQTLVTTIAKNKYTKTVKDVKVTNSENHK